MCFLNYDILKQDKRKIFFQSILKWGKAQFQILMSMKT